MSLDEKSLPEGFVIDEALAKAIRSHLQEGKLSCAAAFAIAKTAGVEPLVVGQTADALQIHLAHCQLGLFGYAAGKGWIGTPLSQATTPLGFKSALLAAAAGSTLSCAEAWKLAEEFNIPKMQVGYLAHQMDIHITPCQLGAF